MDSLADFKIPKKLADYFDDRYSYIKISVFNSDAINGYGQLFHANIDIYLAEDYCEKCKFSSLFSTQKDFDESPCKRHRWLRRMGKVFEWNSDFPKSLEEAFEMWLKLQSKNPATYVAGKFNSKSDYIKYLEKMLEGKNA